MAKLSKEQIAELKQKHGDIWEATSADGKKTCYLRRLTRRELGYASTFVQKYPIKFNEVVAVSVIANSRAIIMYSFRFIVKNYLFIYRQTKNGLNYPYFEVFYDLYVQTSKSARRVANVYPFLHI